MGKIIGFLGRKRSGKDTCGEYLIESYNFTKYAFADPLKDILKILFNFDDEQLNKNKEEIDKLWKISPREALQKFGTDFARIDIFKYFPQLKEPLNNKTIWVKLFELWYEKNKDKNIVITDVRFLDEIISIKEKGGLIFKVNRKSCEKDSHLSEKNIDDYNQELIDAELDNNYKIVDLYSQIDTQLFIRQL